ncbi:MAG: carboxypeptidase-like regulatory domain-containing protein [Chryseobacterium sp.]|nr:carboxypeptidase-like regulatory domain-containing protein [Chryseobacterium sp.]
MKQVISVIIILCIAFSCKKMVVRPYISGYVIDSTTNKALPNVTVTYEGENREENTKTNSSGKYTFTMVEEGYHMMSLEGRSKEYVIKFSKKDYSDYKLFDGSRHGFTTDTKKIDTVRLKPLFK